MAAELADELQRRKRAEADTRKAQATLEVKVDGRHKEGSTRVSATFSILRCCYCCVLPCAYINKIYLLSPFAPHQFIYTD